MSDFWWAAYPGNWGAGSSLGMPALSLTSLYQNRESHSQGSYCVCSVLWRRRGAEGRGVVEAGGQAGRRAGGRASELVRRRPACIHAQATGAQTCSPAARFTDTVQSPCVDDPAKQEAIE